MDGYTIIVQDENVMIYDKHLRPKHEKWFYLESARKEQGSQTKGWNYIFKYLTGFICLVKRHFKTQMLMVVG